MEIFGKSLILTVIILILLIIFEKVIIKFESNNNKNIKENFDTIVATTINKMYPFDGDSSSIVTFEGLNIDSIGRIIFVNDVENENNGILAECVLLDEDRSNNKIKFIPPALSELGITLEQVRNKMKKDNEGYKVSIYLIRKDKTGIKSFSPKDKKNYTILPNVNFFYIDKIPYANNCPVVKPKVVDENILKVEEEPNIEYKKNGDLEFVNEILPKQEEKIDKIISKLKKILNDNQHYQNNDIDFMKTIQALDFLDKYKKNNNSHRYNIHKRISDRFNYNLF